MVKRDAVLVAKTLCQQSQLGKRFLVEIYNASDEPVQLYSQTTLGILTPIEAITDKHSETIPGAERKVKHAKVQGQSSKELPEEGQALVDEARVVITPQQAQGFQQFLRDYQDVFSTKDKPLGQPDVVHHDIRTIGDPIKSQYRWIPMGLKEEAIKEEDRMKKLGVIEPSESSWAAPEVLVRKKGRNALLLY